MDKKYGQYDVVTISNLIANSKLDVVVAILGSNHDPIVLSMFRHYQDKLISEGLKLEKDKIEQIQRYVKLSKLKFIVSSLIYFAIGLGLLVSSIVAWVRFFLRLHAENSIEAVLLCLFIPAIVFLGIGLLGLRTAKLPNWGMWE